MPCRHALRLCLLSDHAHRGRRPRCAGSRRLTVHSTLIFRILCSSLDPSLFEPVSLQLRRLHFPDPFPRSGPLPCTQCGVRARAPWRDSASSSVSAAAGMRCLGSKRQARERAACSHARRRRTRLPSQRLVPCYSAVALGPADIPKASLSPLPLDLTLPTYSRPPQSYTPSLAAALRRHAHTHPLSFPLRSSRVTAGIDCRAGILPRHLYLS
jgi:hypothetical protein